MKVENIISNWKKQCAKYDAELAECDRQEEELRKKRQALCWPQPVNTVLPKLAEALLAHLPGYTSFEVMGPFGLCCECSIYFKGKGKRVKGLSFTESQGALWVKDFKRKTNNFPQGSVGDVNGMNYEEIKIPKNANAQWYLNHLSNS